MKVGNNRRRRQIGETDILQIAGRAGRYRNDGYVTAFNRGDLKIIREHVKTLNIPEDL